ncbi:MOSC domain-containing protein [Stutzerimonas tarimensis]|uniref:MOSC domain-containing protein n=1 Tax=Stutzerimonas tarimensis TaxID=1507735 RepID=A0ABV7T796_9GAMM
MSAIEQLYRYPVKGLSAEPLASVQLTAGQALPLDRIFAITDGSWVFEPGNYVPRPKTDFLVQANREQLAEYRTHYDDSRNRLTFLDPDGRMTVFDLDDPEDQDSLSRLFAERFAGELQGMPRLVRAQGVRFTDVSVISTPMMNAISLVNLASVEALEADLGQPVHPLRFRANLYFRTATAWEELDWVGRQLRIGQARVEVVLRTRRCSAVNVDPLTARRDLSIPRALMARYGHPDMGVYIEVLKGGSVRIGDEVALL